MTTKLLEAERLQSIIGAFYKVYNYFGPGLKESIYTRALELELIARGHRVDREVSVLVLYEGQPVGWHRIDMVADSAIVLESKAQARLDPSAAPQTVNYLKISPFSVALLLHFGQSAKFYKYIDYPKTRAIGEIRLGRNGTKRT